MRERNSQIELLRILAMLMIISHHYAFYGVQQNYNSELANIVFSQGSVANKAFTLFLLPGGPVGVGIFFLIAGFFGIYDNRIENEKIISEVLFYSLGGGSSILYYMPYYGR